MSLTGHHVGLTSLEKRHSKHQKASAESGKSMRKGERMSHIPEDGEKGE